MKALGDKLANVGRPITEKDLMLTILIKLGPGYRNIYYRSSNGIL